MDLQDPTKKMSKSSESPKGVIKLLDDPDTIRKKIMSATTDSIGKIKFDTENQPGISNLINIYISLTGKTIEETEEIFKNSNYGEFKKEVANIVISTIEKIQAKYNKLLNSKELDDILNKGMEKTRKIAKGKYLLMKNKIGLRR